MRPEIRTKGSVDVRQPRCDRPQRAGRATERARAQSRRRRLGRRAPGMEPGRRPAARWPSVLAAGRRRRAAPPSTSPASAGCGWPPRPRATRPRGIASLEDTILLRTIRMTGVEVDAGARRARVEAGALWGDVGARAAEHGLVGVHGSAADVGVVGYTLGGGLGWTGRLSRARREQRARGRGRHRPTASSCEPTARPSPTSSGRCAAEAAASACVTALEFALYPLTEVVRRDDRLAGRPRRRGDPRPTSTGRATCPTR